MKQVMKRSLAMVMVLVLCLGVLSGVTVSVDAAGSWLYNWGTREMIAGELSSYAEAFYAKNDTSYEYLSSLSGSSNLSTVSGSALYIELKELMTSNHKVITSYNDTRPMYAYTDCQNGGGKISSFYSGDEIGPAWDKGATWNREHTWPNSKGDASGNGENDIMMLRPTAKSENGARGNKAYGESGGYYNPNSESGGKHNVHGDVARIMLYVYVRWGNTGSMWGSSGVIESKDVLLKWMAEDPVDTWELGRNDSVQSITGTRNVFVDYPELAFLLFNETVPTDMVTPSGKASSANAYTVTAVANNDAYGTVSVSGKVITAVPAAGYYVAGYTVTSGSATVTQSGNSFVVNAAEDCTVQINFAPKATTNVFFWENGTMASSKIVHLGDAITLPDHTGALPEGYTFVGWSKGEFAETDTYPTATMKAGSSYTVNENTNLFAVYSYEVESEGGGEGTPTTTTTSVTIANYADANGWENSKKYPTVTMDANVTVTAKGKDNTGKYYTKGENWRIYQTEQPSITVSAAEGYTIDSVKVTYNVEKGGVLTYNGQKISSKTIVTVGASSATFGVGNSGTATNGQVRITAIEVVYSGAASGGPVKVTYYTTGINAACQHVNTSFVEGKAATCTTTGWTDGTYCDDCKTYVAGHVEIPASGHETAVWMDTVPSTCCVNGIAGHYHCDICDANYASKTPDAHTLSDADLKLPLNPQNHDADTELRGACDATCTEKGYTGDLYCLGCYNPVTMGTEIPMEPHATEAVEAKEPTHAEDGNIAHYLCGTCGKFFAEEAGTTELTEEQVIIPSLGHEFGEFQKNENKHWRECSCGEKSEEGDHTYGEWITTKKATVGVEGLKERSCITCGYTQSQKIPATSNPATGDNAQLLLWTVLLLVSACGLVTVVALKKRQIG